MRNRLLCCVLLLALAIGAHAQVLDKPVARVFLEKNDVITQSLLQTQLDIYRGQLQRDLSPEEIESILQKMITDALIEQAASALSITASEDEVTEGINQLRRSLGAPVSDEDFLKIIEAQMGLNLFDLRAQIKAELIRRKYIYTSHGDLLADIEAPTEQEIESIYSKNIEQFIRPETILLSHVYFAGNRHNDATVAQRVYEEIAGETIMFSRAVAEYSEDSGSKLQNGKIGYVAINDSRVRTLFGDEFVDYAFSLPVGDISPVVASSVGFHILQVNEHYPAKILELQDPISPDSSITVEKFIYQRILNTRTQLAFEEAYRLTDTELRAQADIMIFEEYLDEIS
jgi:parvulin-like peptidyl-prolyl isomerase